MQNDTEGKITKRKRGLSTARALLEAAAELFAQRGYDGVTMRDIAGKVGIRESSIYSHFSSKADILNTLYDHFIREVPNTRPSFEQLDELMQRMQPEAVFQHILFHVGEHVKGMLASTAMIINFEKFKNQRAADMYYRYVVQEPTFYYETLIRKMIARGFFRPVDARLFAEQYNYVSIALTEEYLMAQYGFADAHQVVAYMIRTLKFFCGQMKPIEGSADETKHPSAATD